jgi:nicotinamide mononucleotide transporter
VLENWWYWLAINIVSAGTYGLKELWVTTGLMAIYAVMSLWGLWEWRRAARMVE